MSPQTFKSCSLSLVSFISISGFLATSPVPFVASYLGLREVPVKLHTFSIVFPPWPSPCSNVSSCRVCQLFELSISFPALSPPSPSVFHYAFDRPQTSFVQRNLVSFIDSGSLSLSSRRFFSADIPGVLLQHNLSLLHQFPLLFTFVRLSHVSTAPFMYTIWISQELDRERG